MNLSVKSPKRRSPKRRSPKRKSPKRKSPKRKSPKSRSPKRRSPKRRSPKRKSPKRKSPKRKSPKSRSPTRRSPKRGYSKSRSPTRRSPKRGYSKSRSPKRKYMYRLKKFKSRSIHRKSHNMLRGGRPKVDLSQEGSCSKCKEPLGANEGKIVNSVRVCDVDEVCVSNKAKKRREEIAKFNYQTEAANLLRLERRLNREKNKSEEEVVNFAQIDVANTELAEKQLAYIIDRVPITRQKSAEYLDDDDDKFFFTIPEPTNDIQNIYIELEKIRRRAFKKAEFERSKANIKTIRDIYLPDQKIMVVYSSDSINRINSLHSFANEDSIEIHCTAFRPYETENHNTHRLFYGHVTIVIRRNDTKINPKQVKHDKETIHYGIHVPTDAPITNWERQFWNGNNEVITKAQVDDVVLFNLNSGNAHIEFLFPQEKLSTILINYYNICVHNVPRKNTACLEGTYCELTEWGYAI